MQKVKCEKCGQTLMLAAFALVQIKCPRCGKINKINLEEDKQRQEPITSTRE